MGKNCSVHPRPRRRTRARIADDGRGTARASLDGTSWSKHPVYVRAEPQQRVLQLVRKTVQLSLSHGRGTISARAPSETCAAGGKLDLLGNNYNVYAGTATGTEQASTRALHAVLYASAHE